MKLDLVFGFGDPSGDDHGTIVLCQVSIGGVQLWLVSGSMGDGRFRIIRDQDFSDPTEELKGVDMGTDPGGQILREAGLREGIMARTQGSHKEIRLLGFVL